MASNVWRFRRNGLRRPDAGFTLVEVLGSLGILVALACLVGGAAAAMRVAEGRAAARLSAGRAVASLHAEARMAPPGGIAEVPGAEGAWAVTAERSGPWEPWMAGFGKDFPPPPAPPVIWRIDARERRPGGVAAFLEVADWPAGGPP